MTEDFNLAKLGDWNQEGVDENFFNDVPDVLDGTTAEEVVEQIEREEKEEKSSKQDKSQETEIDWEDDNPNPDADDIEVPSTTSDTKNKNKEVSTTISAAKLLVDKGIIEYELEEGEELDEDIALELLEEGFENSVDNKIRDLMSGLPTELQALNKYVINGGDMNDFLSRLNTIGKTSGITQNLDITDEKNQILVVTEMRKQEGMDEDFIDTEIENLKDTGKLEVFAKKKFEQWKKQDAAESQKEAQKQEEYAKIQREKARQYYASIRNTVNEEFDGIRLSLKDKNEIPSYMTDRNVKLNNGAVVTKFNQGLMEVLQNESASIQLAKLLRDRKKDGTFDFSQIEKTATTKVVKEVKDNIRRNKEIPRKSVETDSQYKSLSDYF